jgi:hypothetical protein
MDEGADFNPELEAIGEAAIAEASASMAADSAERAADAAARAEAIAAARADEVIAAATIEAADTIVETRFDITVLQEGMTWLRQQAETQAVALALLSEQLSAIITGLSLSHRTEAEPLEPEQTNSMMTDPLPVESQEGQSEAAKETEPAAEPEAKEKAPEPKRRKRPRF